MENILMPFPKNLVGLVEINNKETGCQILEPTIETIEELLSNELKITSELSTINTDIKLEILSSLGNMWNDSEYSRRLKLLDSLSAFSGYHRNTVNLDFTFMSQSLRKDYLIQALELSFSPSPKEVLDDIIEISNGESFYALPKGPIFIIGAGNMITPVVYTLVMSILTNNITLLRPSIGNFKALVEFMESFNDLMLREIFEDKIIKTIQSSVFVMYMEHNSKAYEYILKEAKIGLVNYWGGGNPLNIIKDRISHNPNNVNLLINGPMTGVAVIDGSSINNNSSLQKASYDLAQNIVLFDQKLCSSPTEAYFIGSISQAKTLAELISRNLKKLDEQFPCIVNEDQSLIIQQIRRELNRAGYYVYAPEDNSPNWTIVISENTSGIDETGISDQLSIYTRPRFLEIIVIQTENQVIQLIKNLPNRECFKGIEKVQSVGYFMNNPKKLIKRLIEEARIYRLMPLDSLLMRSSLEPLDGKFLAREFTNIHYNR